MQTPKEVFDAVADRVKERGGQIHPRGIIALRVGSQTSYIVPPDFDALVLTFPAQRAGAAVITLADFAQDANRIAESPRLTESAKSEDRAKLAKEFRPKLEAILDEVGAALDKARAAEAKDTVPVPISPADAADAILDTELRGLLRAKSPGEQMQAVRDEFAFCRALLRQPIGFEPAVIDFAKTCWAKFNPNAPQATAAASAAASWEEARKVVGQCLAALSQLSFGRSGSLPPNPAPAPDAVTLQPAA